MVASQSRVLTRHDARVPARPQDLPSSQDAPGSVFLNLTASPKVGFHWRPAITSGTPAA